MLEYLEISLWVASLLQARCPTKALRAPLSKLWVISIVRASLSVCFTYDSAFPWQRLTQTIVPKLYLWFGPKQICVGQTWEQLDFPPGMASFDHPPQNKPWTHLAQPLQLKDTAEDSAICRCLRYFHMLSGHLQTQSVHSCSNCQYTRAGNCLETSYCLWAYYHIRVQIPTMRKEGVKQSRVLLLISNFWKGVWKHYLRAKLFFLIILHRGEPFLCRFLKGAIKWVEMGNYWRLSRPAEVECRKIVREQILFPLLEEQGRKGEVAKGGSKAASVSTGKNLESRRLRSDCVFILIHILMQDCCQGGGNIHIFVYCLVLSTVSVHKVSTTTVFAQQAACISPPRLSHSLSPSPPFEKLLPSSSL